MMLPKQKTKQGFEMQFGVNHLGHYALTGEAANSMSRPGAVTHAPFRASHTPTLLARPLNHSRAAHLLPLLKKAPAARIINVSSMLHNRGSFDWDDLAWEKRYDKTESYGRSKLANVLFTRGLAKRLKNTKVRRMAARRHCRLASRARLTLETPIPAAPFPLVAH